MTSKQEKPQRFSTQTYKNIALTGYVGLIIYMPLWLFILAPGPLSNTLTFILFILPLLFPLKGILLGNPYTYAWSNFIVLIYFLHSLTTMWVQSSELVWATIELLFASLMFYGGTYYAKYKGRELGLGIRKQKKS